MKKWECTVCGYIHEGEEPPDECPICGAGKEYFKEITETQDETLTAKAVQDSGMTTPDQSEAVKSGPSGLTALVLKLHLHPISVHTPNGVLPLALIFLVIALVFNSPAFETAAFFNLVFVLLTLPVVIATGYLEWQNRYKGARTKIFGLKIAASIVVSLSLITMVVWRLVDPDVAVSANRWIYALVGLIMVFAAGIAGHIGGKFVFDKRDH